MGIACRRSEMLNSLMNFAKSERYMSNFGIYIHKIAIFEHSKIAILVIFLPVFIVTDKTSGTSTT